MIPSLVTSFSPSYAEALPVCVRAQKIQQEITQILVATEDSVMPR